VSASFRSSISVSRTGPASRVVSTAVIAQPPVPNRPLSG
jgi:hypothetical protein